MNIDSETITYEDIRNINSMIDRYNSENSNSILNIFNSNMDDLLREIRETILEKW